MDTIIKKVKAHCFELFSSSRCNTFPFHNIRHTLDVFENVKTIGEYEGINKEEMEILKIAALFHDTGFSQAYNGHENLSINNAQAFLCKMNYSKENIENVVNCIKATKMPQNPNHILEKIICDADLFHLASPKYKTKNMLLRKEWSLLLDLTFTDEQWKTLNIDFFKNHEYKTSYGKSYLALRKLANIEKMETSCC